MALCSPRLEPSFLWQDGSAPFHHGDEFHLVLSGEWAAQVEGKPDHIMKSGNAQYVERERWHGGQAIGSVPLKVLGVMIVDKDKPIIEMKR